MHLTRRQWLERIAVAPLTFRSYGELTSRVQEGHYVHLLNASTNQQIGVPFRVAVAVLRLGLKKRCRSQITFRSSDPRAILPPPYQFSSKDDLYESHLFDITLRSEGQHTVSVTDEKTSQDFSSNIILVSNREPKYKLYFGDIHIHSRWSGDGRGDPDYNYIYARDAMNLDFACLTEHDPADEIWEKIKALARELYQAGRFATLAAYEWTADRLGEGHKNVYYKDWNVPLFRSNWRNDLPAHTNSAADLWAKLRASGKAAITIPHHPASKAFPVPWDHYDRRFQRCVEIYSGWGSSESKYSPRQIKWLGGAAPGHFVQDALAAGQRLGFVAASDSHSGRPGYPGHARKYHDTDYSSWMTEGYTGGFTGIYAEELTRDAVFDAIWRRRCYATTGQRIVLDFRADDHWMGEEFQSRHAPHFHVKVIGTAPLESVTLVKNNQDYLRLEGKGWELSFQYGKTEPPQDTDWYYVRAVQQDGEMAWSSPIWISRK